MTKVVLRGLIRVPEDRVAAVSQALQTHIDLTREETGCLLFNVEQRQQEPCVFDVYEEFTDKQAFDFHQKRVSESEWGQSTGDVVREYTLSDSYFMQRALELANEAASMDEVPVGALVVRDNKILGEGFNQPIALDDPTAHAEILAIRSAAKTTGNYRLQGSTLYCTIEPCSMCAGALIHARVQRLVYGATEPRAGAIESSMQLLANEKLNHRVSTSGGVMHDACAEMMTRYFSAKRQTHSFHKA